MNINIKIGITEDEKRLILDESVLFFAQFDSDGNTEEYLLSKTNFSISILAILDSQIVGFYLLSNQTNLFHRARKAPTANPNELSFYEDIEQYSDKKGLEGIALLVLNKFRGLGIGKLLISKSIEYAQNNGYDYIFGGQLKTLRNVENWQRAGRFIIAENKEIFVTLMNFESTVFKRIKIVKDTKSVSLDLSHCKLKEIPEAIFELDWLEILTLNYNDILSIPSHISKLKNLKRLSIIGNKISYLSSSITSLKKLKILNLSRNIITSISSDIEKIEDLEELILQENKVAKLPNSFSKLKKLYHLDLSFNCFKDVPIEISQLPKLRNLDLSNNKISFLDNNSITSFSKLVKLRLENNSFPNHINMSIKEETPNVILGILVDSFNKRETKNVAEWTALLSQAKTKEVLEDVEKYLSNNQNDLFNEIVLLRNNFEYIEASNTKGIISLDDSIRERNKIVHNLLKIISKVNE